MQDLSSFWTDIKNLEERLANSPDSLCFAQLSEVYLKVGLVDDALHVARKGLTKHPRYLSGLKAFSQACYAKGLSAEALSALKQVTEALPEDVASQKLLGRLSVESGDYAAARQAFQAALEFAPDDVECRLELESLAKSSVLISDASAVQEDDEEILEDLEVFEEAEILDDEQDEFEMPVNDVAETVDYSPVPHSDPLSTGTVAELYVSQGFIQKALDIYRAILADNPADFVTSERVSELEAMASGTTAENSAVSNEFLEDDGLEESPASIHYGGIVEAEPFSEPVALEPALEPVQQSDPVPNDELPVYLGVFPQEEGVSDLSPHGTADNAINVLDGWLENIRRIKSCR